MEYWDKGYIVSWVVIPNIDQQYYHRINDYIFKISPHEEIAEHISTDSLVNWPNSETILQTPPQPEKKNCYHESS